jgi:hypothetical protein
VTDLSRIIVIDYTNHRGERRKRRIQPIDGSLHFGSTPYHPERQWLFDGIDVERNVRRTFALLNLHAWENP